MEVAGYNYELKKSGEYIDFQWAGQPGSVPSNSGICIFAATFRPSLGSSFLLIQWAADALSPDVKWLATPFCFVLRLSTHGAIAQFPMCLITWSSVKYRDNFVFSMSVKQ
jgi:hypothetical protein